jgi:hypothetical protein
VLIPPPPPRILRGGDVLAAGVERSTAGFRGKWERRRLFWRCGVSSAANGVIRRDVSTRLLSELVGE